MPERPAAHRVLLGLVLAYSIAVNTYAIWWGLPGVNVPGWAPDEIRPESVVIGMQAKFSGGWNSKYPPTHYYIIAGAYRLLFSSEELATMDPGDYARMAYVARGISVIMSAAIVLLVYLCGLRVFDRPTGTAAAFFTASIAPMVYYSKTANVDVPYLLWYMLALLFFLRSMQSRSLRDHVLFGLTAMISICTKDTAYGLFVLPGMAILVALYREHRPSGPLRALVKALFDRRIIYPVLAAIIAFVLLHNLAFNMDGFQGHIKRITGAGKEKSVIFENTVRGHLGGLTQSLHNIYYSLGAASSALVLLGVCLCLLPANRKREALHVALPALSCYIFMVSILRTNFDRHLLPISIVLTFFGGYGLVWLLRRPKPFFWISCLLLAAVIGYSVIYALSVDLMLAKDSRIQVRQWVAEHAKRPERVVEIGRPLYLPGYRNLNWRKVGRDLQKLRTINAEFLIMNTSDIRSKRERKIYAALTGGKYGYKLSTVLESPPPLHLLRFDKENSNLAKVSPPLAIFERSAKRPSSRRPAANR